MTSTTLWKIRLLTCVTLILSMGLAFLIGEFVLRFFVPAPVPAGYISDCEVAERFGWGFPPNHPFAIHHPDTGELLKTSQTNSRGWKDKERAFEKPEGVARILVVGDSVTFGVGPREEIFPAALEQLLRDEGYRVEVMSIGMGGWATDQEFEAYKQEGVLYSPDIVISQFCGNDLGGILMIDSAENMGLKPFRYYLEEGELKIEERERTDGKSFKERMGTFLYFKTRIYFLLAEMKKQVLARMSPDKQEGDWFLQFIPRVDSMWEPGPNSEYIQAAWDLYGKIIEKWDEECEENGSLFYVFSESYEQGSLNFNLSWDLLKQEGDTVYARNDQDEWAEVDFYKPRRSHEKTCKDHGVRYVRTTRSYQRYQRDPHSDATGNLRMAEDIRDHLLTDRDSLALLDATLPLSSTGREASSSVP